MSTPYRSEDNSTSTPLSGDAVFEGEWELALAPMLLIQCISDVAGTLYVQFSADGSNAVADSTFPFAGEPVSAGVPTVIPLAVGGRFFRVRYVNGSAAQSYLRMTTTLSEDFTFMAPLNQAYKLSSPAQLMHGPPWWLQQARGLVTGITTYKKFGRILSASTSAYSPVALGGVWQTPQSGSATALRVKAGGNANDTAAGSGARAVKVTGLDENFDVATATLATAGASASSASSGLFTRLNFIEVTSSGSYATSAAGSHAAAITIENSAGGTDWGTIGFADFPKGRSEIGAFACPRNSTAYVFLTDFSIDSGKTVDLVFFTRENIDETSAPYTAMQARSVSIGLTGGDVQSWGSRNVPFGPFPGPCDLGFMVKADTSVADVSVEFEIFVVAET